MFQLIDTFFDALLSNCKGKLIGISSDGASNMTGAFSGVVTRLQKLALPGLYCFWCCAHQWIWLSRRQLLFYVTRIFVNHNGYHQTFAPSSKPYFRNAIQMSMVCQYLLVVNGTISLLFNFEQTLFDTSF